MSNSGNSWMNNAQWSTGQGPQPQQQGNNWGQGQGNWMQGNSSGPGEWQAMQQAPPTSSGQPAFPQGQGQGQGGQFYSGGGGFPGGQFGGGGRGAGFGGQGGMSGAGFQGYGNPQQQFMNQQQMQMQRQQELERRAKEERERKAREEQKQRELEIQRRKMKQMNISKPSAGSFDELVAMPASMKTGGGGKRLTDSPMLSKAADTAKKESAPQKTYSPSMKAREWTVDTSSLEGVFAQHAQAPPLIAQQQQQQADDFGEFHSVSANAPLPPPSAAMATTGVKKPSQVPQQQKVDTSRFPPIYMEVYRRCVQSGETHLSTELLFPILLSSQLPKNVLGDLWTQANKSVPGKLSQMELFVLLGLIGLVQAGNQAPTVADLKKVPLPPVPKLSAITSAMGGSEEFGNFQHGSNRSTATEASSTSQSLTTTSLPASNPPQATITTTTTAASPPDLSSSFPVPDYKPPPDDKYSVFNALSLSEPQPAVSASATTTSASDGDKYGAFKGFSSSGQAPGLQPAVVSNTSASGDDKYGAFKAFSSAPASSAAAPSNSGDDQFGAFKGGIQAPAPISSFAASDSGDKFGAFQGLNSGSLAPIPATVSSVSENDKYGAFKGLQASAPISSSAVSSSDDSFGAFQGISSSVQAPASNTTSSSSGDIYSAPGVTPSNLHPASSQAMPSFSDISLMGSSKPPAPPSSISDTLLPDKMASSNTQNDDFGEFSSGPPPLPQSSSDLPPPAAAMKSPGWADFTQFSADPVPGTMPAGVGVNAGTEPAVPAFGELLPMQLTSVAIPNTSTTTVTASSAFDDLVPKELTSSKENTQVSSLSKSTPEGTPKLGKRLKVLDEEMLNRPSEAVQPTAIPTHVLQPEQVAAGSSTSSLDHFGDFEGFLPSAKPKGDDLESNSGSLTSFPSKTTKPPPDPVEVWCSCLAKCLEVLAACAAVFASVQEKNVLKEIVEVEEGRNRMKSICEVYRLSRRLYYSIKEKKQEDRCKETTDRLREEWRQLVQTFPKDAMEELYQETHPTVAADEGTTEGDFLSDTISRCSVCVIGKTVSIPAALSLVGHPENYPLPLLFHEGQMYHASCANFWINVMQEKLPELSE